MQLSQTVIGQSQSVKIIHQCSCQILKARIYVLINREENLFVLKLANRHMLRNASTRAKRTLFGMRRVSKVVCPCNWIREITLGALCPQPWPASLVQYPCLSFSRLFRSPAGDKHLSCSSCGPRGPRVSMPSSVRQQLASHSTMLFFLSWVWVPLSAFF